MGLRCEVTNPGDCGVSVASVVHWVRRSPLRRSTIRSPVRTLAPAEDAAAHVDPHPRGLAGRQADGVVGAPIVGVGQVLVGPEVLDTLRHLHARDVRPDQPLLEVEVRAEPLRGVGEVEQRSQAHTPGIEIESSHQSSSCCGAPDASHGEATR